MIRWACRSRGSPVHVCRDGIIVPALRAAAVIGLFITAGVGMALATEVHVPSRQPGTGINGLRFVGSSACAECHPRRHSAWLASQHHRAMQVATASTVLGDFGGVSLAHFGVTSTFSKKDGRFFVNTEGPDGSLADFEIAYTFGVDPLQQYLIAFPGGRLQSLTIAWDTKGRRWFSLYPEERIEPGNPLHWTGRYQTWNGMCAECHATNLRKGYDPDADAYQTLWSEIGVGCEACHGPGEAHVGWARAGAGTRGPETGTDRVGMGLVVRLRDADGTGGVDACARCHSRRNRVSAEDERGRPFLDDFLPATLREGLYHADGQILDEVYVYGSYIQSKMYRAGVRCTDCHEPHGLALEARGNTLCVRCHGTSSSNRFPGLPRKAYDAPAHHFHANGSAGALCVNCHMPARTYMLVDPRRDHSFRIPRPDLSARLGTPNACNTCHGDRSSAWAAEITAQWRGESRPVQSHYGEALAAGRRRDGSGYAELVSLVRDQTRPGIARATALELLHEYGPKGVGVAVAAAGDTDPLVRVSAVAALDGAPPELRVASIGPLLKDPTRAVRVEAARVLSWVRRERLPDSERPAFDMALEEYTAAQLAMADMPAARLNLGVLYTNLGRPKLGETFYQAAIRMDGGFTPARLNLANLYNRMGRNDAAERTLREAIEVDPGEGEIYYSLGLLLGEERRLEEAASALAEAVKRLPGRPRVQYNYGLALQHLGRRPEAEQALKAAYALSPEDPKTLHALVVFYGQDGAWERARPYARDLVRLFPVDDSARLILERVEGEMARQGSPAPGR